MERLTQRDLRALLLALGKLYAVVDLDAFPQHLLTTLPRVVPSDITGYNEVNPKRARVTGLLEPFVGDVQDVLTRFARHIGEHPVIRYTERTGDGSARKISDFLSQREFRRRGLYREFYRPLGIEHQMAISIPAPASLVIGIVFNRRRPDFSERERLLLDLLRPHVVKAYENAEVVTQLKRRLDRPVGQDGAHDVVVLDRHYRVRWWTERTRRQIGEYLDEVGNARRLPDRLERWVRGQHASITQDAEAPSPRAPLVIERPTKRLVLRLVSDPVGDQHLLLLEEQCRAVGGALESLGLTRRESEVLRWVIEGKTNREIATILALSPLTVRTHLEHMFAKLGVETRTAAAVRGLEALGRVTG